MRWGTRTARQPYAHDSVCTYHGPGPDRGGRAIRQGKEIFIRYHKNIDISIKKKLIPKTVRKKSSFQRSYVCTNEIPYLQQACQTAQLMLSSNSAADARIHT